MSSTNMKQRLREDKYKKQSITFIETGLDIRFSTVSSRILLNSKFKLITILNSNNERTRAVSILKIFSFFILLLPRSDCRRLPTSMFELIEGKID